MVECSSKWTLVLSLLIILGKPLMASEDQDHATIDLNTLLATYEAACLSIPDYDITMRELHTELFTRDIIDEEKGLLSEYRTYRDSEPHKVNTITVTRHRFLGGKYRVDWLQHADRRIPEGTSTRIWDGATAILLDTARSYAEISSAPIEHGNLAAMAYGRFYWDFGRGYSFTQFVRARPAEMVRVSRRDELILVRVEPGYTNMNGSPFGIELSLNPSQGFMPVRIDSLLPEDDEAVVSTRLENQLAEVHPGVWLPVKSRHSYLVHDRKSRYFGQESGFRTYEVDEDRSQWGASVDDSAFQLNIPVGTTVKDRLRNATYQVGTETKEKYLDTLAVLGRLSVEETKRASPPLFPPTRVSLPWGKLVLLWTNILGLGCLIACTVYWVWNRRKASGTRTES